MFGWPRRLRYAPGSDFIRAIAWPFAGELAGLRPLFDEQVQRFRSAGQTADNSTSFEDCVLLYLLVRQFNARTALDVGTNVGMTATFIDAAAKKNGGECITCDPIDYRALKPDIRFINTTSDLVLGILKDEGRAVDFAFFDWVPDLATMRRANEVFTKNAVIGVHDYIYNSKGELIVHHINATYERIGKGTWHFPTTPVELAPGVAANMCSAFWIPNALL